ncbi:putative ATP-dependent Clp protease [Vibrio phage VCPH]|nr:putative ATP-dependent Clp protease [Vibrio phage VCPH]
MLEAQKKQSNGNDLTDIHVLITVKPDGEGSKYRVYLDQPISDPKEYRNLVEFMDSACEGDTFELVLNGPGGNLYTCLQLIHSIANTKALVIGHLVGEICSAHSNIFMACHEHVVYPYGVMMVHTFSGGFWGKGEDTLRSSKAHNELTKTLYTDLFSHFMTEEELYMVLHGNNDSYFLGQDIVNRLTRVYEAREAMRQQLELEAKLDSEDKVLEQAAEILAGRASQEPEVNIPLDLTTMGDVTTMTNAEDIELDQPTDGSIYEAASKSVDDDHQLDAIAGALGVLLEDEDE